MQKYFKSLSRHAETFKGHTYTKQSSARKLDYLPINLSVNAITLSGMDRAVSCPFLFFVHLSIEGQSTLL